MDKIFIQGMVFYGYHGMMEHERVDGQPFEIDVELGIDLSLAGKTDDIRHTVSYAEVYQSIKLVVEEKTLNLIEALAEAIAQRLLNKYPFEVVKIRVRKPRAPVPGPIAWAAVEIERKRPNA